MAASAPSVGPNRLYVGNLPIGASSELLRNVFVQFGPLSFVEIKDKAGSHFAYVQYEIPADAAKACLALDHSTLPGFDNENIRVGLVRSSAGPEDGPKDDGSAPPDESAVRIAVVLVAPQWASNVGAVARLCRVFNVARLVLISPACDHVCTEARLAATHGQWYLDNAIICDSVPAVRAHCYYLAAFSARVSKNLIRTAFGLPEFAKATPNIINRGASDFDKSLGLVFGRESDGLTNQEISDCDSVVQIPINSPKPVLNLSHAVSIALYETCHHIFSYEACSQEQITVIQALWDELVAGGPRPAMARNSLHNLLGRGIPSSAEAAAIIASLRAISSKVSRTKEPSSS